jgi:hypothetical protein
MDGQPDTPQSTAAAAASAQQPHEFVGKMVRRFYHGRKSDGKVVAYLPPDEKEEAQALWHMVHVDGDEEDLELDEVTKAIELYEKNVDEVDEEEEEEVEEDNLQDREEDGSEDDDDEESDDEEQDESKRTLWATWGVRERWRSVVRNAKTIGQISLALMFLKEAVSKYGMWDEVKSKEARSLGSSSSSSSLDKRRSGGGSLLKQLNSGGSSGGYVGRAAAAAAKAKIAKSARDEQSIFGEDEYYERDSNKRRKSGQGDGGSKKKNRQSGGSKFKSPKKSKNRRR